MPMCQLALGDPVQETFTLTSVKVMFRHKRGTDGQMDSRIVKLSSVHSVNNDYNESSERTEAIPSSPPPSGPKKEKPIVWA